MIIYIILLTFRCVIGEDLQQMELDTVLKGLDRFLTGLVVVRFAIKIGPRSDTNLFLDNLVPLKEGCFIKQVFVESKNCVASFSPFLLGFLPILKMAVVALFELGQFFCDLLLFGRFRRNSGSISHPPFCLGWLGRSGLIGFLLGFLVGFLLSLF